ncbi:MAG: DUF2637 domain-containing protein [Anaerolineales bacterium]|nr:DUF2637 domain-containing protein [Anaerolineales bacterium]
MAIAKTVVTQGRTDTVKLISTLAAVLVALLAIGAFTLSYTSLKHLAIIHGIDPGLTWLWPLLLDFAMVVFSLAVLRANLRGESTLYPWMLTATYAGLATVGNVLDVSGLGIPGVVIAGAVKALAPVSLVLAFELLMAMIRAELKRANVLKSIADLKTEAEAMRQETERERQERQTELERLAVEQEKVSVAMVAEQERLEAELKARKHKLEQSLAELATRKEALQVELAELRKKKQWMVETGEDTKRKAATILIEMHRNGHDISTISGAEIGRWVERSARTGLEVKKEVVPLILQGGPQLEALLDGKGVAG